MTQKSATVAKVIPPKTARTRATKIEAAPEVEDASWNLLPSRQRVLAMVPTPMLFEPSNKVHREAFAFFLVHKKWPDGIRFQEEHPFTSAVTTIEAKLTHWAIRSEIKAVVTMKQTFDRLSK